METGIPVMVRASGLVWFRKGNYMLDFPFLVSQSPYYSKGLAWILGGMSHNLYLGSPMNIIRPIINKPPIRIGSGLD